MLIFDETDLLSMKTIEFIRDIFDRRKIGLLFIGASGTKKRLSRFSQFIAASDLRTITGH